MKSRMEWARSSFWEGEGEGLVGSGGVDAGGFDGGFMGGGCVRADQFMVMDI